MLLEHQVFVVFDFAEVVLPEYVEGGGFHEYLHLILIFEIEIYVVFIFFFLKCLDVGFL